ncbi:MAG TPA: CoA transferase [Solirubrobacterales bacterium]|nr:CoA transferase [Solirubrobacterales bacterium]
MSGPPPTAGADPFGEPSGGPLGSLRVVEAGRFITAPYASMLLADLGARVVKVEAPEGDPFRVWDPGRLSPRFAAFNRNKRSLTLDLREPGERLVLGRLLDRADVFVHNFRPAGAERLGLAPDRLREEHPDLVVCAISGAGTRGPLADQPMYDQIGQALSGLMSVLSGNGASPPVGPALSDAITGLFSAMGILAALLERERTGTVSAVDASLVKATISFLGEPAGHFFATGEAPGPHTRPHQSQSFVFPCADGKPVVVHLSTPTKFWLGLLGVLGAEHLDADPRFADYGARVRNYDALAAELAPPFLAAPASTWLERLREAGVPSAPILTLEDVADDPGIAALGAVTEIGLPDGGTMRAVDRGVDVGERPPLRPPPGLGEHSAEILAALGLDRDGTM